MNEKLKVYDDKDARRQWTVWTVRWERFVQDVPIRMC